MPQQTTLSKKKKRNPTLYSGQNQSLLCLPCHHDLVACSRLLLHHCIVMHRNCWMAFMLWALICLPSLLLLCNKNYICWEDRKKCLWISICTLRKKHAAKTMHVPPRDPWTVAHKLWPRLLYYQALPIVKQTREDKTQTFWCAQVYCHPSTNATPTNPMKMTINLVRQICKMLRTQSEGSLHKVDLFREC